MRRQDFGERKEKDEETKADLSKDMITSRTDYYNTHKTKLSFQKLEIKLLDLICLCKDWNIRPREFSRTQAYISVT